MECFSTLARLLDVPDAAFQAHLALLTDPAIAPPDVAGQVALFAERVASLSSDERQELFTETFPESASGDDRLAVVVALRSVRSDEFARAIVSIDRLSRRLARDRNPYLHLCIAARALLAAI